MLLFLSAYENFVLTSFSSCKLWPNKWVGSKTGYWKGLCVWLSGSSAVKNSHQKGTQDVVAGSILTQTQVDRHLWAESN